MKISVVVPTYNRPEAIARCVRALQEQDVDDLEIVVVDDGSPEPVASLPEGRHELRLLRQDNAGPATARNTGVAAARGELICLTDDDCRPHPGWARAYAEAASSAPGLMAGRTVNAVEDSIFSAASQDMADYLTRNGPGAEFAPSNNLAIRREQYLAIGGFPTHFQKAAGEDRAFCASAVERFGPVRHVEAVVEHDHALDLRGFWRQHRNYGHGAYTWHGLAKSRSAKGFSGPGFYAGLVLSPMRGGVSPVRMVRSGLVVLAQLATTQGYLAARRADKGQAAEPKDFPS